MSLFAPQKIDSTPTQMLNIHVCVVQHHIWDILLLFFPFPLEEIGAENCSETSLHFVVFYHGMVYTYNSKSMLFLLIIAQTLWHPVKITSSVTWLKPAKDITHMKKWTKTSIFFLSRVASECVENNHLGASFMEFSNIL